MAKNLIKDINKFKINSAPIEDYLKQEYYRKILPYIKGKVVLDVGCTAHDLLSKSVYANEYRLWSHWFLYKMAKKVIGIDIEKKSVETMNYLGFNAKIMDAEHINFDEKFDVVFAGELIEHLTNPGLFLKAAKRSLVPGGIILLSTPNTFSLHKIIRIMQGLTNEPPENSDHTMYFSPLRLETLAKKCGLRLVKIDYSFFPFARQTPFVILNKLVCKIIGKNGRFKEQIMAVLK